MASPRKIEYERVRAARAKLAQARSADPAGAIAEKSVTARLIDTYHKVAEARGFRIESDEPEFIGGTNAGPQPTEFMLMSLAFCQMSIVVMCAVAMRVELNDIEITVTAKRDSRGIAGLASVRPGYYDIRVDTKLVSEASTDRLRELARMAEARCPVSDNLSNPTPLSHRVSRGDEVILESSAARLVAGEAPGRSAAT